MLYFWFFTILAVVFIVGLLVRIFKHPHELQTFKRTIREDRSYYGDKSVHYEVDNETPATKSYFLTRLKPHEPKTVVRDAVWGLVVVVVVWFLAMIPGIFVNAATTGEANNAKNSMFVIENLTDQRDDLLKILQDNLTNDDFVQLIDAANPDQILFLRQDPDVDAYLLGRADRLVNVNAALFAEQRKILGAARGVCNTVQNPFIPQLPFGRAECNLDTLNFGEIRVEEVTEG